MDQKSTDYTEKKDYLDSLADKLEALGLAEGDYVNQLSDRLEPILTSCAPSSE